MNLCAFHQDTQNLIGRVTSMKIHSNIPGLKELQQCFAQTFYGENCLECGRFQNKHRLTCKHCHLNLLNCKTCGKAINRALMDKFGFIAGQCYFCCFDTQEILVNKDKNLKNLMEKKENQQQNSVLARMYMRDKEANYDVNEEYELFSKTGKGPCWFKELKEILSTIAIQDTPKEQYCGIKNAPKRQCCGIKNAPKGQYCGVKNAPKEQSISNVSKLHLKKVETPRFVEIASSYGITTRKIDNNYNIADFIVEKKKEKKKNRLHAKKQNRKH